MRLPCPHCGCHLLGIGWKQDRLSGIDWCCVICRKCSARGPECKTEEAAWAGWDSRRIVDEAKMGNHLKLCRKNLKSSRVVCCASCPFEKLIVGYDIGMAGMFDAKRIKLKGMRV